MSVLTGETEAAIKKEVALNCLRDNPPDVSSWLLMGSHSLEEAPRKKRRLFESPNQPECDFARKRLQDCLDDATNLIKDTLDTLNFDSNPMGPSRATLMAIKSYFETLFKKLDYYKRSGKRISDTLPDRLLYLSSDEKTRVCEVFDSVQQTIQSVNSAISKISRVTVAGTPKKIEKG